MMTLTFAATALLCAHAAIGLSRFAFPDGSKPGRKAEVIGLPCESVPWKEVEAQLQQQSRRAGGQGSPPPLQRHHRRHKPLPRHAGRLLVHRHPLPHRKPRDRLTRSKA